MINKNEKSPFKNSNDKCYSFIFVAQTTSPGTMTFSNKAEKVFTTKLTTWCNKRAFIRFSGIWKYYKSMLWLFRSRHSKPGSIVVSLIILNFSFYEIKLQNIALDTRVASFLDYFKMHSNIVSRSLLIILIKLFTALLSWEFEWDKKSFLTHFSPRNLQKYAWT